ncbi:MAG: high-affinity iron transporter [Actinomycetota bacterium]|jgi:high-affinity iron transporter|nr:high-affinity iron transporter [Actinomycetota bacterium]
MTGPTTDHRPPIRRLLPAVLLAAALWWVLAPAAGAAGSVSRTAAVRQLDQVRQSIDQTLERVKSGNAQAAFAEAKSGYLNHFELVEIPLRVVAPRLTADAETKFAEIRGLISSGAPTGQVRDAIIELRRLINDSERQLTSTGLGAPSVVAGQSFLIIFREGLEAVLLLSALLGYLEAAKASQYRRPVVIGMGAAVVASIAIFFVLRVVLDTLPFGREVLEAVTAIVATVVLFYVSFWLIARLEQRRWLEFLRSRVWSAVSVGSTTALVLVGFTAVFREGFETSLMYQALVSFGQGLVGWILLGLALGLAALTVVAYGIFKLGRKLPIKTFLSGAVVLLMATSVAFLGNAVRSLQEADVIGLTPLHGWPRAPIFLSQALGYWPSRETVLTQAVLALVYVVGAVYMFVIRPRAAAKPPARPKEDRAPVRAPAQAQAPARQY